MRQNMGAGFGKCLGQGKDKNGEQQHLTAKYIFSLRYKGQGIKQQEHFASEMLLLFYSLSFVP